jgi:hypothetical protein
MGHPGEGASSKSKAFATANLVSNGFTARHPRTGFRNHPTPNPYNPGSCPRAIRSDQLRLQLSREAPVACRPGKARLLNNAEDLFLASMSHPATHRVVWAFLLSWLVNLVLPVGASPTVNVPAAPPNGSEKNTIGPNFLGISLELSYMDQYCNGCPCSALI